MNTSTKLLTLAGVFCAGLLALAAEKDIAGPKGGRLLEKTEPKAEFFVEKDRTVTVTFYDTALKPVVASNQTVAVVADAPGGKTTVEFERKDGALVSKGKLPDGDGYNLVVRFTQSSDAKPQNFRFKLNTSTCGECKYAEYACTCGH